MRKFRDVAEWLSADFGCLRPRFDSLRPDQNVRRLACKERAPKCESLVGAGYNGIVCVMPAETALLRGSEVKQRRVGLWKMSPATKALRSPGMGCDSLLMAHKRSKATAA